jgi:hypothetical protein
MEKSVYFFLLLMRRGRGIGRGLSVKRETFQVVN